MIRLELVIRQEGVDVMGMNCNCAVENEIRVARVVSLGGGSAFEVSGRTPEVRTKVELEKFLEELKNTVLSSFRLD